MQLEEVAKTILLGTRWEEKLIPVIASDSGLEDTPCLAPPTETPRFPGRPGALGRIGKAEFPKDLSSPTARGRLLHFFANHELLAMELMALMLLKFPDAPKAFRAGIARTIADEQSHLRLYIARMRELGVDFGELPVNDYFWNAMKDMRSPLEFVTQMSLTLEQANLDFSLTYQRAVKAAGDVATAAILERVHREEIEHVRHGVEWFNRFRNEAAHSPNFESDWDAYLRLLPSPMTPRRAKGVEFSAESRRRAGLSERFIRELEACGGSKGRPPVIRIYNPHCDQEIARGKVGLTASDTARRLSLDLEALLMHLSLEEDIVLTHELPDPAWLASMKSRGFVVPEFQIVDKPQLPPKISGIEPWGWSPEPFERFKPVRSRLTSTDGANGTWCRTLLSRESFSETGLGELFSKAWSVRFLRQWLDEHADAASCLGTSADVGVVHSDWPECRADIERRLAQGTPVVVKASYGTSGTQNKRVLKASELDSPIGGWTRNTIEAQGAVVVEPWLAKEFDLSMQIEVRDSGDSGIESTSIVGVRRFLNGPRLEYRGTFLDPGLANLPSDALRFLHTSGALLRWQELARDLGAELRRRGYRGPAGLDALLWRRNGAHPENGWVLKPLVELNPRWTMGRIAIELESHVLPGVKAVWAFLPLEARTLGESHPPRFDSRSGRPRLAEGILFTTDPARARETLTALVAGESALRACGLMPDQAHAP